VSLPQGGEREGFSSLPLLVGLLIRPSPGICALPSSGFSLSQGLRVSRHEEFYSLFMRIAWPIRRWEVELAALSRIFRIFAADMVSTFGRGLEAGFGAGPLVVWGEVRLGYALHRKGHDVAWPSWWACNISGGGAYIMVRLWRYDWVKLSCVGFGGVLRAWAWVRSGGLATFRAGERI